MGFLSFIGLLLIIYVLKLLLDLLNKLSDGKGGGKREEETRINTKTVHYHYKQNNHYARSIETSNSYEYYSGDFECHSHGIDEYKEYKVPKIEYTVPTYTAKKRLPVNQSFLKFLVCMDEGKGQRRKLPTPPDQRHIKNEKFGGYLNQPETRDLEDENKNGRYLPPPKLG